MLDDALHPTPRTPITPDRRATPASIDLIALCHSLPADGHLSSTDLEVLKDWTTRYRDVALPAQEHIAGVVNKALARQVITPDDRQWMYAALEPALPVQLRKQTQEQRLLAEIAAAEREGAPVAVISFDFLVAGVHLEGRWRTIQSHVRVGDPVQLVRSASRASGGSAIRVMLASRACIGLVPEDEARMIAQELDCGGRVEAVVKKILNDGQYPIPVIGSRVFCNASDDAARAAGAATSRNPIARWRVSKLTLTLTLGLAGGALLVLALLTR